MARTVRTRRSKSPPSTPLAALLYKYFEHLEVKQVLRIHDSRAAHPSELLRQLGRGARHHRTSGVEVTRTLLEQYQKHVFHYRKKNGEPLGFTSQRNRVAPLRTWFRWLARQYHVLHNPASGAGDSTHRATACRPQC